MPVLRLSSPSRARGLSAPPRLPAPSLPPEDLTELLREAGMPRGFPLDWLIDRLERPAERD